MPTFDPDDVLGWPLEPLSDEYKALVTDHPINSGDGAVNWLIKSWNPMSHSIYWTDDDVLKPLVKRSRLCWRAHNEGWLAWLASEVTRMHNCGCRLNHRFGADGLSSLSS